MVCCQSVFAAARFTPLLLLVFATDTPALIIFEAAVLVPLLTFCLEVPLFFWLLADTVFFVFVIVFLAALITAFADRKSVV